jgi:hypothetical protein
MLTDLSYECEDKTAESGSLHPSLSTILFPDFDNSYPVAESPAAEAFTVDSLDKASWAVSKILESEARITRRVELARDFKNRIEQWLESANRQDSESVSYLLFLLEPYVQNEVSKLHNSKSLSLPTGIASLRKLPDRLEILDSTTALAYCESEHPEAVIIKKELDKSFLKDLILKQAEPVPGVTAELALKSSMSNPLKQPALRL